MVHQHDVAADHHQADTGAGNGADKFGADHIKNVQPYIAGGGVTQHRLAGDDGSGSQTDDAQKQEGQPSIDLFQDHGYGSDNQERCENHVQNVHSLSSKI